MGKIAAYQMEGKGLSHRILIVDPNQAFASMLEQSLKEAGDFSPRAVNRGKDALKAIAEREYDLAIVDMGLEDMEGAALLRQMRQSHPRMRLAVIPLEGDQVPAELGNLDLQGALPKPFFLPELPGRITAFLSRPVGGEEAAPVAPAAPAVPASHLTPILARLAQEVGAEAVILSRNEQMIAHVGSLSIEEISTLAGIAYESWQTSARVARILGKEQLRFEQSIEGDEHLLYSLALSNELILSIVIRGRVHLGMIRHQAKESVEAIRQLIV